MDEDASADSVEPLPEDRFPELTAYADSALRLVAWLIENQDVHQLARRTGLLECNPNARTAVEGRPYALPIIIELPAGFMALREHDALHTRYGVPRVSGQSGNKRLGVRHFNAELPLSARIFGGDAAEISQEVQTLLSYGVSRLAMGAPGQPSEFRLKSSLAGIGLPADRKHHGNVLTGEGVVIGLIDDGCALAHSHFLEPRQPGVASKSRVRFLLDQGAPAARAGGWTQPPDNFGGLELDKAAIDAALALPEHRNGDLVREDAVYEHLEYKIDSVASHGTRVMDIAAGNGQSLMGSEGVACKADIIFVQLPTAAREGGATVLWKHILEGVEYIFARADQLGMPAVVNISYGGYDGPHDGTSALETGIDARLAEQANRAVVMAAGNGFEADCHAFKALSSNGKDGFRWVVRPEDPSANDLEIWYDDTNTVEVRLRSPGPPVKPQCWIRLGSASQPIRRSSDSKIIGQIEHLDGGTGNRANRIVINLRPTARDAEDDSSAPAPAGVWTVEVRNKGGGVADLHAWIWRDDAGRKGGASRRQSHFHPDDADPRRSISGWATGALAISVGAINSATQEICSYSACGPTRRKQGELQDRQKPEIYAPAAEDVRGRGILCASSLSARQARINGTSASAPHVTGLIALLFEYAQKHAPVGARDLTAAQVLALVKSGFNPAALKFDRRQAVDTRVRTKQSDVQAELSTGRGKTDFVNTLGGQFP